MSDAEIRELEKLARSGDVSARAKWLVGRVRSGALSQERLEVAAYAGDEASRLVVLSDRKLCTCDSSRRKTHERNCPLGGRKTAETEGAFRIPRSTVPWLRHLPSNREALVTAWVAVLDSLPRPRGRERAVIDPLRFAILDWLLCPCDEHSTVVDERRKTAIGELRHPPDVEHRASWVAAMKWLTFAAPAVVSGNAAVGRRLFVDVGESALRREATLRPTISNALINWALGERSRGR